MRGGEYMKKVSFLLWLMPELRNKFKDVCKKEGITMSRKMVEMIEKEVNK